MPDDHAKHVHLLVQRGADALGRRDFAEAINALEAALELEPDNAEAARYLKFAQLGVRKAASGASGAEPTKGIRRTVPPGGFGVLRPRKRKPSGEVPSPHVKAGDDES